MLLWRNLEIYIWILREIVLFLLIEKHDENVAVLGPALFNVIHVKQQGLDFDANQRIDSRRDSRHTIVARIKVDSRERYHD